MTIEKILGPVGKIKDIKPAAELGGNGLYPVAIIEHQWFDGTANAWIEIPVGQEAAIGDEVRIFTIKEENLTTLHFIKREK